MAMALFGPWLDSSTYLAGVVPVIILSSAVGSVGGGIVVVISVNTIGSGGCLHHKCSSCPQLHNRKRFALNATPGSWEWTQVVLFYSSYSWN
jgi:hypothetical protein